MKRGALYRARVRSVMSVMVGHPPTAAWPRKSVHRCDYCGSQFGDMRPWDWPPDNPTRTIWLHERGALVRQRWSAVGRTVTADKRISG
jgi:hypothetical protein